VKRAVGIFRESSPVQPADRRRRRIARVSAIPLIAFLSLIGAPFLPSASAATTPLPKDLMQGRVLALRPNRIEVILNGHVRRVVPAGSQIDLADLPGLVGDNHYVYRDAQGRIQLDAVIAARPGTALLARSTVGTLVLGDADGQPARVTGSTAALSLRDLSIIAPLAAHGSTTRPPTISYGNHSKIALTNVTISGGGAGLRLRLPDSAKLQHVRTTNTGGNGTEIRGGVNVQLTDVQADEASGEGILLAGPFGQVALQGLRAQKNNGDGIVIQHLGNTQLKNVTTHANAAAGLRLSSVQTIAVSGLSSSNDGTGLVLDQGTSIQLLKPVVRQALREALAVRATTVTISGARVTDSFEGLVIRAGSTGVQVLAGSDLAGTRDGIRVEPQVTGVLVRDSTLRSSTGTALRFSGVGGGVQDSHLLGSIALAVPSTGGALTVEDSSLAGSDRAMEVAAGAGTVNVSRDHVSATGGVAISANGRKLVLDTTTVDGAEVGLAAHGEVAGRKLAVKASAVGIRLVGAGHVILNDSTVSARSVGVAAGRNTNAILVQTSVHADDPSRGQVDFRGTNHYSHLPVRWVALAALLAVATAILLEVIRKLRDRRDPHHGTAPDHVLNRT
jgi:hypothetical protein